METKIDALINKMEQSRSQLNRAMEVIAPQAEIYPTWKLKQVMDHITGWDELIVDTLHAYQMGELPERPVRSIDHYNEGSVSARQSLSLEQSRQAFQAAREEVLQILRSLPAEMFDQEYKAPWGGKCTIPVIIRIFASHEQEHARQIEEIASGTDK